MNIEVITHFDVDDVTFSGDYLSVTIEIDGTEVIAYGDYYHNKGREQAYGFVDACKHFFPECIVKYSNVSSGRY